MKIFIGAISAGITQESLEAYLRRFGPVESIRLMANQPFGFATFGTPVDADGLLRQREHYIDGRSFIVELSHSERREDGDRRGCRHCDACPVHGRGGRARRGPDTEPALILAGLPPRAATADVLDLAEHEGFNPAFIRMIAAGAVVGFSSQRERDDAMRRLDGAVLRTRDGASSAVATRPYAEPGLVPRDRAPKRPRLPAEPTDDSAPSSEPAARTQTGSAVEEIEE